MSAAASASALIGFLVFAARRLLTYLHLFQQEEYDGRRFLSWLAHNPAWDRRLSLILAAIFVAQLMLSWAAALLPAFSIALVGIAGIGAALIERDPRKTAKKPLAMTARATRIYVIALVLAVAIGLVVGPTTDLALAWIVPVPLLPPLLVVASLVLTPFQARVHRRYWHEALRGPGR